MKKVCGLGICFLGLALSSVVLPQQKAEAAVKTVYVTKGESVKITVKKATKETKWSISKKKNVKLSKGKNQIIVKGQKKGISNISTKIAKKKYQYKICVETPKISKKSITLKVNDSAVIKMTGTKRKVKWKTTDSEVVALDEDFGDISAIKGGTATVYTKLGKKKYQCKITVKEEKMEGELTAVPNGYLSVIKESGTVTTVEYEGTQADGNKVKKLAYVYLPYGYDSSKEYDILYCLHGGEGDTKAYLGTENSPANVKKLLDNMIAHGDIKPLIAVAPTYYTSGSDGANMGNAVSKIENFTKNELINELIPAVEGKYKTYAKTTDLEGIKASRDHRGYTGFSMGSLSTWRTFLNSSDYFHFFMPMSGDCWINGVSNATKAAETLENYCKEKKYGKDDFFIYAVTGSKDIAYSAMNAQINAMKSASPSFLFTTEGAGTGNISFHVQPNATHSYVYLPIYFYNGLQSYFK